jgi:opacity protein-like surface antigen
MYLVFLLALGLGQAEAKEDSKSEKSTVTEKKKSTTTKKSSSSSKSSATPKKQTKVQPRPAAGKNAQSAQLSGDSNRVNQNVSVHREVGQETQPNAHQALGNREPQNPTYNKAPSNVIEREVGQETQPNASSLERPERPRIQSIPVEKPSQSHPQVGKPTVNQPKQSHPQVGKPTNSPQVKKPKVNKPKVKKPSMDNPVQRTPKETSPQVGKPTVNQPKQSHPQVGKPTNSPQVKKPKVNKPSMDKPVQKPPVKKNGPKKPSASAKTPAHHKAPSLTEYENQPTQWTSGFNSNLNDPQRRKNQDSNTQKIDRGGQTSLSINALSYASGYNSGLDYEDGGLGIALGLRPWKNVGAEVSYGQYTDALLSTDPERVNRPLQAVAQGFLFPDQLFTPFVSAGYVQNSIYLNDQYTLNGEEQKAQQNNVLTGGVLGAGIEMNISTNISLELDARYFMYSNTSSNLPARDNATLTSMGVNFYF